MLDTLADRMDALTIFDPNSGCWLWGGTTNANGYGRVWVDGQSDLAHTVSYRRHNGPIPEGLLVRHRCDNPGCINPDHLETGTLADNSRDCRLRQPKTWKGKFDKYRGELHPKTPFCDADVLEIRRLYASGARIADLARSRDVDYNAIKQIVLRNSWTHI